MVPRTTATYRWDLNPNVASTLQRDLLKFCGKTWVFDHLSPVGMEVISFKCCQNVATLRSRV